MLICPLDTLAIVDYLAWVSTRPCCTNHLLFLSAAVVRPAEASPAYAPPDGTGLRIDGHILHLIVALYASAHPVHHYVKEDRQRVAEKDADIEF